MASQTIAIIGGGIGGLTTALALRRVGLDCHIYEQAPELREIGAGLGLWSASIRCLEQVGVSETFWTGTRCPFRRAEIGTPDGRVLTSFEVRSLTEEMGKPAFAVHRAELHAALVREIDPGALTLGAVLTGLHQDADGVTLRFQDGREACAGIVVGADGLESVVRTALFGPSELRYSGETCYRGVAPIAVPDPYVLREVQGPGLRCAVHPLDTEHVYWWAARRAPAGLEESPTERKDLLARLYAGWKFGFPEALAATEPEAILKNDLFDRRGLSTWTRGRVTLLGDAAHPTTPNLGMGANMAIEDAIVLARALATHRTSHERAFAQYEAERMGRARRIVRMSAAFGRLGSVTSPWAVSLRELVTAVTPSWIMKRSLAQTVVYDAGPLPAP